LPFADPDRVVLTWSENQNRNIEDDLMTYYDLEAFREESELFSGFAASVHWGLSLRTSESTIDIRTMLVSANLFDVLGAQPLLGRTFRVEEEEDGNHRVAVISEGFWQRQYGGDSTVVGSTMILDGEPFTLVGVMPSGFMFPDEEREMWVPLAESYLFSKAMRMYPIVGKMKPAVSLEAAEEELTAISTRLADVYPDSHVGWTIRAENMLELVVGDSRRLLMVLQSAVGLVLLIVCANVASLVLARTTARKHDLAVRTALGAGRGRLVRQMLTESVVLAGIGGGIGIGLAVVSLQPILALAPAGLPRIDQIGIDGSILAFALGLSVLTGFVFGTAPAWRFSRAQPAEAIKDEGWRSTGGLRSGRVRNAIVVVEHALAVMLLVGAGLLVRTVFQLHGVDPGFAKENVLSATIYLQDDKYETAQQQLLYYETIIDRIAERDGIMAVGATNAMPLHPVAQTFSRQFLVPGKTDPADESVRAGFRIVTPGYFSAVGISQLAGRDLTRADRADAPHVVLINQALADRYWPNENPVGQRVLYGWSGTRDADVIGVVGNVRHDGLRETPAPEMYVPFAQATICGCLTLVVRTAGAAAAFVEPLGEMILELDRTQPAYRIDTMDQLLGGQVALERFVMILVGMFAGVALLLAGIGIYGVMSYTVNQSIHEIGIRTALGADRGSVVGLVLKRGLMVTALGTGAGLMGAVAFGRTISSVMYEVSTTDAATYVVILGLSVMAGVVASYLPARKAARVDPIMALRGE
jgi:putative ABC transport system permease protein